MPRAEAGSNKAIGNAIKAKGLGRLRWYCQICEKQCRDENGFQAHSKGEPHLRKLMLVGPKAGQTIAEFSQQFQSEFISLLRTRHNTQRVRANTVYNEYIQDKHHIHMNATRWVTLSGFIQTLGKAGIVKVDEDDKGLWIVWIDNTPKTLAKQAAALKRDRAEMDGEERERRLLEDQIKRAKASLPDQVENDVGLIKNAGEKISLNLFGSKPDNNALVSSVTTEETIPTKPEASTSNTSLSFSTPFSASAPTTTPISIQNPLKRPAPTNIFKQSKAPKTEGSVVTPSEAGKGKGYMSEAERLMKEDLARKMGGGRSGGGGGRGGYGGYGPRRGG